MYHQTSSYNLLQEQQNIINHRYLYPDCLYDNYLYLMLVTLYHNYNSNNTIYHIFCKPYMYQNIMMLYYFVRKNGNVIMYIIHILLQCMIFQLFLVPYQISHSQLIHTYHYTYSSILFQQKNQVCSPIKIIDLKIFLQQNNSYRI